MLCEHDLQFVNLNNVLILPFNNVAVSSTSGFIICGSYEQTYYKRNNAFILPLFETHKLCCAFYEIIDFFSDDEKLETEPRTIINLNNEVLYWVGNTLHGENIRVKKIQICLESQSAIYKFDVLFDHFQIFLIAIEKSIRSAFCFKIEDMLFLNFILKDSFNNISSYTDDFEAYKCVKRFNTYSEQFYVNINFLQYYLEIILVLKKLNCIIMDKNPRKEILNSF
jgi:hypothetical protein